jgi:hypothetical protein
MIINVINGLELKLNACAAKQKILVKVYLLDNEGDGNEETDDTGMRFIMREENEETVHLRLETTEEIKNHICPKLNITSKDVKGIFSPGFRKCGATGKLRTKSMRNSKVVVIRG